MYVFILCKELDETFKTLFYWFKVQNMDPEVVVATRYDTAVRTAVNFLSVFLAKCGVKNNEEVDYRPLFENFVQVTFF